MVCLMQSKQMTTEEKHMAQKNMSFVEMWPQMFLSGYYMNLNSLADVKTWSSRINNKARFLNRLMILAWKPELNVNVIRFVFKVCTYWNPMQVYYSFKWYCQSVSV